MYKGPAADADSAGRLTTPSKTMPTEALGIAGHPFWTFVFLLVNGYALYWLLAALSYLFFFVWKKNTFNPGYRPDWRENLTAMKWGFYSVAGNALLTAPIHVLIANGHSKAYSDVNEFGWGYLVLTIVILLSITETAVYWAHRILHWGPLWDRLHKYHHQFHKPTPWVGVAFHPLDSFMQGLPHHLCVFLFPININVYLVSVTLLTIWAVSIHDRVSIVRWGAINYAGHHTLHHYYDDYNFGQYTTFWDRLCGTYRSPRKQEYWPPKKSEDMAYAPSS